MKQLIDYKAKIARCRALAAAATDESQRDVWLKMEQFWLDAEEGLEKLSERSERIVLDS